MLIAGLGNREVTPDALGPGVVDNLFITRHVVKEYGKYAFGKQTVNRISSIVPGVMAQTGMETQEIIHSIVKETKPDLVVAVDALAARSTKRLNRTIQVTDTGINPGSGVGNHRHALDEKKSWRSGHFHWRTDRGRRRDNRERYDVQSGYRAHTEPGVCSDGKFIRKIK